MPYGTVYIVVTIVALFTSEELNKTKVSVQP